MADEAVVENQEAPKTDAGAKPEPTPDAPKYTDKQLNDLLVRDAGKEVKKLLAEAGLDPSGDVKADLAKLKAARDAQLTEEQKRAERDKAVADELSASKREASEARAESAALKAGVPADKCERVRKLALAGDYEGDNEAEKVAAVLKDFPEFVKAATPSEFGGKIKAGNVDEQAQMLAQIMKNAGIKQ